MSDSVWPQPWDSPGKNTGVGCHFLLQRIKVKSESEVAQSCLTLCNPMDCSLPGSSVHGIFLARVLEWGAIAFSKSGLGPWFTFMVGDAVWVVCHIASHYEANHAPILVKLSLITWLRRWSLYCPMWISKWLVSNRWWVILHHCFKTLCHCVNTPHNPQ